MGTTHSAVLANVIFADNSRHASPQGPIPKRSRILARSTPRVAPGPRCSNERASVTKQAIGEVVSDLEAKGLVNRVAIPRMVARN